MTTLPTELVVDVLARLPFKDHVIATHVCSAWRAASHENPAKLWSRFLVDSKSSARTLRDVLRRSQHPTTGDWVPVDIYVELAYDYGPWALSAIAEHMHHIRALAVYQSPRSPLYSDAALKIRAVVLLSAAPLLEQLEIEFTDVRYGSKANYDIDSNDEENSAPNVDWKDLEVGEEVVPSDIAQAIRHPWLAIPVEAFAGQAPRLRSLNLMGGFVMPQDCPALANVRALIIDIGSAGEWDPNRRKELEDTTVQSISRLPLLQHLWISYLDLRPPSFFAQRPPVQRSLNELRIQNSLQDPTMLLRYFNYQHASLVCTEMYDGWTNAFETNFRSAPAVLEIRQRPPNTSFNPDPCDWNLSTTNDRVWILPKPYTGPFISALYYLARNLIVLSLPITEIVGFTELRFTQLERLVIVSDVMERDRSVTPPWKCSTSD